MGYPVEELARDIKQLISKGVPASVVLRTPALASENSYSLDLKQFGDAWTKIRRDTPLSPLLAADPAAVAVVRKPRNDD